MGFALGTHNKITNDVFAFLIRKTSLQQNGDFITLVTMMRHTAARLDIQQRGLTRAVAHIEAGITEFAADLVPLHFFQIGACQFVQRARQTGHLAVAGCTGLRRSHGGPRGDARQQVFKRLTIYRCCRLLLHEQFSAEFGQFTNPQAATGAIVQMRSNAQGLRHRQTAGSIIGEKTGIGMKSDHGIAMSSLQSWLLRGGFQQGLGSISDQLPA